MAREKATKDRIGLTAANQEPIDTAPRQPGRFFISARDFQSAPAHSYWEKFQMTCWRLNPEPPMANAIEALARSEGRTVSNCLRKLISEALMARTAPKAVPAANIEQR
jgi:hypothetical protein